MQIARIALVVLIGIMLVSGFACGGDEESVPTATPIPTPSPTSLPSSTPMPPHVWDFPIAGCFPNHLPDAYNGHVVPAEIDPGTIPQDVQGVYWWNSDEWLFWAPDAPGTNLATLGGGHTFDYLVCVTGPCEWQILLP